MNLDDIVLTDDLRMQLIAHRGGCACHSRPPCGACCEPLTEDEADLLGLLPITTAKPTPAVDFASITRSLCK